MTTTLRTRVAGLTAACAVTFGLAAAFGAGPGLGSASAALAAQRTVTIASETNPLLCIEAPSRAYDTQLIMATCSTKPLGAGTQRFVFSARGELIPEPAPMSLPGPSACITDPPRPGPLRLQRCNGSDDQRWQHVSHVLMSGMNGCIDSGMEIYDGRGLSVYHCLWTPDELWTVQPV